MFFSSEQSRCNLRDTKQIISSFILISPDSSGSCPTLSKVIIETNFKTKKDGHNSCIVRFLNFLLQVSAFC
jgi:hypothetical protein